MPQAVPSPQNRMRLRGKERITHKFRDSAFAQRLLVCRRAVRLTFVFRVLNLRLSRASLTLLRAESSSRNSRLQCNGVNNPYPIRDPNVTR